MSKYLSNEELGNVQISEDVVIAIVSVTAAEVEGVVSTGVKASAADWKDLIGKKGLGKNVRIELAGEKVSVDLDITVEYGLPIAQIAENVQKAVHDAITSYTGLDVDMINVHVCGITFPKSNPKQG